MGLKTCFPITVSAGSEYLRTKDDRKQWEYLFSNTYIDPILKNLEGSIARALDAVANDDQQGNVIAYCIQHV